MSQPFSAMHTVDDDGNPAGGRTTGTGIDIVWQNGPLGRGEDRQEPNGAFVDTVIAIARDRIDFYQHRASGRFACMENAIAIGHLDDALSILAKRTERRELAGTEGTNVPDSAVAE